VRPDACGAGDVGGDDRAAADGRDRDHDADGRDHAADGRDVGAAAVETSEPPDLLEVALAVTKRLVKEKLSCGWSLEAVSKILPGAVKVALCHHPQLKTFGATGLKGAIEGSVMQVMAELALCARADVGGGGGGGGGAGDVTNTPPPAAAECVYDEPVRPSDCQFAQLMALVVKIALTPDNTDDPARPFPHLAIARRQALPGGPLFLFCMCCAKDLGGAAEGGRPLTPNDRDALRRKIKYHISSLPHATARVVGMLAAWASVSDAGPHVGLPTAHSPDRAGPGL